MKISHMLLLLIVVQFFAPTLKEIIPHFTPLQDIPLVIMFCTFFILAEMEDNK